MPRQSRIEIPGFLYHIMARGVGGHDIFLSDKDKDRFLDRLGDLISRSDHECYAWSLMSNHFHLLVRLGKDSLGGTLKRLLTSHAVYFNRKNKRFGHLFQNRYKAILCQEDAYFVRLVRYIHLNPIRAGIVNSIELLNNYAYSGHSCMMGKIKNDWQDTHYPLSWFGKDIRPARRAYLKFVEEGISDSEREELRGGGLLRTAGGRKALKDSREGGAFVFGDERVLGDSNFVEDVLRKTESSHKEIPRISPGYDLERITREACRFLDVDPREARGPNKRRVVRRTRAMICYIATRELKLKGVDIAEYLGINQSTVSRLLSEYVPDENLNKLIDRLKQNI